MTEIGSINHGVRAWTREDHPGKAKEAAGHQKEKFQSLLSVKNENPTNPVEGTDSTNVISTNPNVINPAPTENTSGETSTLEDTTGTIDLLV